MKMTQSLPIDGETQSFVSPFEGHSVVTEAERVLCSGEAFAADNVDRESHLSQAVRLAAAPELVMLVGLSLLEA